MTNTYTPIFSGDPEEFHWAGFGSGTGTNLRECAKVIPPALIFTDKPNAKLLSLEELAKVPKIKIDGIEACGLWKKARDDPEAEAEYVRRSLDFDKRIVDAIRNFEHREGFTIDLIVLGGYMRFVREPLLVAYKDRIINVHPADLSLLKKDFSRQYVGEKAVYDALAAGELSTRSSVIMVDDKEDHGEILTMGPPVYIDRDHYFPGKIHSLKEYAGYHQDIQKELSDWPALTIALRLIADGSFALGANKVYYSDWRGVYLDGRLLPYKGLEVTTEKLT